MVKKLYLFTLLSLVATFGAMVAMAGDKVEICHYPPGNPENVHTIEVSQNAVPHHLDHGDVVGSCTINGECFTATNHAGTTNLEAFQIDCEATAGSCADDPSGQGRAACSADNSYHQYVETCQVCVLGGDAEACQSCDAGLAASILDGGAACTTICGHEAP